MRSGQHKGGIQHAYRHLFIGLEALMVRTGPVDSANK
jgi:hypothetical protein